MLSHIYIPLKPPNLLVFLSCMCIPNIPASSLVTAPRGSMLSLQVYPQFEGTLSSSSSIGYFSLFFAFSDVFLELAIKQFNFESKSSSLTPSPFEVPFFGCTLWDDSQQRTQNSNQPWRSSQSQYSPRASRTQLLL